MAKLLMITGLGSAKDLASGKKGAFYNTLEEFHKYWERVDIIAPRIKNHGLRTLNLFGNVYIHVSPWPIIFHPFWFLKKGIQIYKEQKFDLMTVHEFPPFYNGIGARLLWQKIRVPYILEIHHIPGYPRAANIKEKIYRTLMRLCTKWDSVKAKAVRVVNKKQTSEFLIKAGVPANKISYIPSAYIDLEVFRPMNLEKEYDLIFVGRLAENKGIHLLLEAASKLKAQSSNLKILIVGNGPLRDWVQSQITNYQLPITNFGWAKDSQEVARLLNQSKILVMPSYNEGGPRVVLEAMACGVPVLATSVGIVPDVVRSGESGEIIDWDSDDIVGKAEQLLNDHNKYEKYSRVGVELAKQFEKRTMIKNYTESLKKYAFSDNISK